MYLFHAAGITEALNVTSAVSICLQMRSPTASVATGTWWSTGLTKPRANPTSLPKVTAVRQRATRVPPSRINITAEASYYSETVPGKHGGVVYLRNHLSLSRSVGRVHNRPARALTRALEEWDGVALFCTTLRG